VGFRQRAGAWHRAWIDLRAAAPAPRQGKRAKRGQAAESRESAHGKPIACPTAPPVDCTAWVATGPAGPGTCSVTVVTVLITVATGGVGGSGAGGGDPNVGGVDGGGAEDAGAVDPDGGAGGVDPDGDAGGVDPDGGAEPAGDPCVGVPPAPGRGAIVPMPPPGATRTTWCTGALRGAGGRANVCAAGMTGAPLGAGGPAKICPSTPSWLKPPPSANTTSAASIAHGTAITALEAANS
jgi:hypothetical protein